MGVNADNFIFHSDFWYPTGYLSGAVTVVSQPMGTLVLSDKYEAGDYYSVYIDLGESGGGMIGENFFGFSSSAATSGSNLELRTIGQFPGATFSGTIHWRIYRKPKSFSFDSRGKLERTAKSIGGSFLTNTNVPIGANYVTQQSESIISGLSGKYFVRGIWQVEGEPWVLVNSSIGSYVSGDGGGLFASMVQVVYNYNDNAVKLSFVYRGLPKDKKINYRFQLVPVIDDSPFVFDSRKYSFAIPKHETQTITDSGTLAGKAKKVIYGDWIDLPGEKLAYDFLSEWSGDPGVTWAHGTSEFGFSMASSIQYNVVARPSVERQGNRIRPVLRVENLTTTSKTYPTQTVTYRMFVYQDNNSN